ncbi:MAG: hypothetical protein RMJ03_01655, partial [Nitrososphaerota archaeon]|nr:hypothetical protein [Nitrososphaerota archaeon]
NPARSTILTGLLVDLALLLRPSRISCPFNSCFATYLASLELLEVPPVLLTVQRHPLTLKISEFYISEDQKWLHFSNGIRPTAMLSAVL